MFTQYGMKTEIEKRCYPALQTGIFRGRIGFYIETIRTTVARPFN